MLKCLMALPTKEAVTFNEYSDKMFLSWTKLQLQGSDRIDIVWDRYVQNSLKQSTREKRGRGVRRKVKGQTKLPTNFPDFYVTLTVLFCCAIFSYYVILINYNIIQVNPL